MKIFEFNVHGICTNQNLHSFARPGKTVEVCTAMAADGGWRYGMSADWADGGHSFGASLLGPVFASEGAALAAALESAGWPSQQLKLF